MTASTRVRFQGVILETPLACLPGLATLPLRRLFPSQSCRGNKSAFAALLASFLTLCSTQDQDRNMDGGHSTCTCMSHMSHTHTRHEHAISAAGPAGVDKSRAELTLFVNSFESCAQSPRSGCGGLFSWPCSVSGHLFDEQAVTGSP
ncbi:hypothetical protein N658DRAFT_258436 [Parathielavia hyrcaniae]|uniref:Uncharacterized protein n=1 Tax=Parathielavia hyrcaniae TaxID=113614 RepID=A0AAN6SYC4_9PEZI|nr:hypothetical protein N658DRAFT_258436 [Parathielavia hyrcaniae]